jgi:hypothetical protein
MRQVIENDELEEGYKQLKAAISKHRPDLITMSAECTALPATPVSNLGPVLLLGASGDARVGIVYFFRFGSFSTG